MANRKFIVLGNSDFSGNITVNFNGSVVFTGSTTATPYGESSGYANNQVGLVCEFEIADTVGGVIPFSITTDTALEFVSFYANAYNEVNGVKILSRSYNDLNENTATGDGKTNISINGELQSSDYRNIPLGVSGLLIDAEDDVPEWHYNIPAGGTLTGNIAVDLSWLDRQWIEFSS